MFPGLPPGFELEEESTAPAAASPPDMGVPPPPSGFDLEPEPESPTAEPAPAPTGFMRRTAESFRRGAKRMEAARTTGAALTDASEVVPGLVAEPAAVAKTLLTPGAMAPEQKAKVDAASRAQTDLETAFAASPIEGQNWLSKGIYATADMMGGMWNALANSWDEALAGAAIGAGVGARAGGARAAVTGAGVGFGRGLTAGSAKEWYLQGLGDTWRDMQDQGIDPGIARKVAAVAAAPYAAIEFVFTKLPGIRGVSELGNVPKDLLKKQAGEIAARMALRTLVNSGGEIGEEAAQRLTTDIAQNVAAMLHTRATGEAKETMDARTLAGNMLEEALAVGLPVLLMGGVAGAGWTAKSLVDAHRLRKEGMATPSVTPPAPAPRVEIPARLVDPASAVVAGAGSTAEEALDAEIERYIAQPRQPAVMPNFAPTPPPLEQTQASPAIERQITDILAEAKRNGLKPMLPDQVEDLRRRLTGELKTDDLPALIASLSGRARRMPSPVKPAPGVTSPVTSPVTLPVTSSVEQPAGATPPGAPAGSPPFQQAPAEGFTPAKVIRFSNRAFHKRGQKDLLADLVEADQLIAQATTANSRPALEILATTRQMIEDEIAIRRNEKLVRNEESGATSAGGATQAQLSAKLDDLSTRTGGDAQGLLRDFLAELNVSRELAEKGQYGKMKGGGSDFAGDKEAERNANYDMEEEWHNAGSVYRPGFNARAIPAIEGFLEGRRLGAAQLGFVERAIREIEKGLAADMGHDVLAEDLVPAEQITDTTAFTRRGVPVLVADVLDDGTLVFSDGSAAAPGEQVAVDRGSLRKATADELTAIRAQFEAEKEQAAREEAEHNERQRLADKKRKSDEAAARAKAEKERQQVVLKPAKTPRQEVKPAAEVTAEAQSPQSAATEEKPQQMPAPVVPSDGKPAGGESQGLETPAASPVVNSSVRIPTDDPDRSGMLRAASEAGLKVDERVEQAIAEVDGRWSLAATAEALQYVQASPTRDALADLRKNAALDPAKTGLADRAKAILRAMNEPESLLAEPPAAKKPKRMPKPQAPKEPISAPPAAQGEVKNRVDADEASHAEAQEPVPAETSPTPTPAPAAPAEAVDPERARYLENLRKMRELLGGGAAGRIMEPAGTFASGPLEEDYDHFDLATEIAGRRLGEPWNKQAFLRARSDFARRLAATRQTADAGPREREALGRVAIADGFGAGETFGKIADVVRQNGAVAVPISGGEIIGFRNDEGIFVADTPAAEYVAIHELGHELAARGDAAMLRLVAAVDAESDVFQRHKSALLSNPGSAETYVHAARKRLGESASELEIAEEVDRGIAEEIAVAYLGGMTDLAGAFRTESNAAPLRRSIANRLLSAGGSSPRLMEPAGSYNAGERLSPEVVRVGSELAGYQIGQGVKTFDAFARAIKADVADLWPRLRPHLRTFWEAAAVEFPDIEEVSRAQAAQVLAAVDGPKENTAEAQSPQSAATEDKPPKPQQMPAPVGGTITPEVVTPEVVGVESPLPEPTGNDLFDPYLMPGDDYRAEPNSLIVQVRALGSIPVPMGPVEAFPYDGTAAGAALAFLENDVPSMLSIGSNRESIIRATDGAGRSIWHIEYRPNNDQSPIWMASHADAVAHQKAWSAWRSESGEPTPESPFRPVMPRKTRPGVAPQPALGAGETAPDKPPKPQQMPAPVTSSKADKVEQYIERITAISRDQYPNLPEQFWAGPWRNTLRKVVPDFPEQMLDLSLNVQAVDLRTESPETMAIETVAEIYDRLIEENRTGQLAAGQGWDKFSFGDVMVLVKGDRLEVGIGNRELRDAIESNNAPRMEAADSWSSEIGPYLNVNVSALRDDVTVLDVYLFAREVHARVFDLENKSEEKPPKPQQMPQPALGAGASPADMDAEIRALLASEESSQAKAVRVRKLAERFGLSIKAMQEKIEAAVVVAAHAVMAQRRTGLTAAEAFKDMVALYNRQPVLSARTSTSVENQAYSTPPPMAFALAHMTDPRPWDAIYDATAGNGMLLMGGSVKKSVANELNPDRAAELRRLGVGTVTQNDARTFVPAGKVPVVHLNPPFGSLDRPVRYGPIGVEKLEHLIALRALEAMEDNGTAAMILGASMNAKPTTRGAQWVFENYLHGFFNVVDTFEVDGDLYGRQGAKWPVRIIVLAGRKANGALVSTPLGQTVDRLGSWEEVWQRAERVHHEVRERKARLDAERPAGLSGAPADVGTIPGDTGGSAGGGGAPAGKPGRRGGRGNTGGGKPDAGGPAAGGVAGDPAGQPVPGQNPAGAAADGGDGGRQPAAGVAGRPGGSTATAGGEPEAGGGNAGGPGPGAASGRPGVAKTGTDLQVAYEPRSGGTPFGTLIPNNIAEGLHAALDALKARVGDLDAFVGDRLNMPVEDVRRGMAAEQIDGAALAIDAIEHGGAVIIGDETGIGKGRQAAAIIRYAMMQGKVPLFFTKDPKLFTDMFNDLGDIGTKIRPLVLGAVDGNIVNSDGTVIVRATTGPEKQGEAFAEIRRKGIRGAGYDAIFLTYSQIRDENERQRFLEELARDENVIVIMDEAHESAGDKESSMQAAFFSGGTIRRGKKPDVQVFNKIGILNLPGSMVGRGGVVYLSATYAKRPDNMPAYFRTALGTASDKMADVVNAMEQGGVALQQAVSEALAKAGQYVRRERDFTGVPYVMDILNVPDREAFVEEVDGITDILTQIVDFSKILKESIKAQADGMSGTALSDAQMDVTDFASIVHNQIGQLLLAAKADAVVERVLAAHRAGEKPVIALMNTMESILDNYTEENNIRDGGDIQLRWNELLRYALGRTLRATVKHEDGSQSVVTVSPAEFGLEDLYAQIERAIDAVQTAFPVSPIDYIVQKLERGGMRVGELTGRKSGIAYAHFGNNSGTYRKKRKANKNELVNGFNSGRYDALLLNASGSTGLSIHASVKFADQKPRHMFIVQPALDINIFVQTLGRIKRTGMVPGGAKYTHVSLPLQAEMRPALIAKKKMRSLNANTTGDSESAVKIDADDILNKYGDLVVAEWLVSRPEMQRALRLEISENEEGGLEHEMDLARKFTSRMSLRPDFEQAAAYGEIMPAYRELIQRLKTTGEYDLEIVVHDDWDGTPVSDELLSAGKDESSIFTSGVRVQQWEIRDPRHVPTGAEMQAEQERNLGDRQQVRENWRAFTAAVEAEIDQRISDARAAHEAAKSDPARSQHAATLNILAVQRSRWEQITRGAMGRIVSSAGNVLELRDAESGETFTGMLVDAKMPKLGQPFLRVAPGAFRFKFLVDAPGGVLHLTGSQFISQGNKGWTVQPSGQSPADLTGAKAGNRYVRYFITGNPIAAYRATGNKGKMVRFATRDGSIVTGLQMPNNWNPDKLAEDPRRELASPEAAAHFLRHHGRRGRRDLVTITSDVVAVRLQSEYGSDYVVTVPSARTTGGRYFLDAELRDLMGDFNKTGNRMQAIASASDLPAVMQRLQELSGRRFRPLGSSKQDVENVQASNTATMGGKKPDGGRTMEPAGGFDSGPLSALQVLSSGGNYEQTTFDFETRPGSDNAIGNESMRKAAGEAARILQPGAADASVRRRGGSPISTIGSKLAQGLVRQGGVRLTGLTIANAADVHQLVELARNPYFETFRLLFVQDGRIVEDHAYSMRLPGVVAFDEEEMVAAAKGVLDRLGHGATVYAFHNHPSGNTQPSVDDVRSTRNLARSLGSAFTAHIVGNHGEFTHIQPTGAFLKITDAEVKKHQDPLIRRMPAAAHALLGRDAHNARKVAEAMRDAGDAGDDIYLLGMTPDVTVKAVGRFPRSALANPRRLHAAAVRFARTTGSNFLIAANIPANPTDAEMATLREAIAKHVVADGVAANGYSVRLSGRVDPDPEGYEQSIGKYKAMAVRRESRIAEEGPRRMPAPMSGNTAPANLQPLEQAPAPRRAPSATVAEPTAGGQGGGMDARDRDYLAAVERGDMATAQRMVDEAARAAGYSEKGFHGTPSGGFENFKATSQGIFFSDSEALAKGYTNKRGLWLSPGKNPQVVAAFLRMDNPLTFDANGARYNNVPYPGRPWKPTVFGNLPANAVNVRKAAELAFEAGHDGLVIRNVKDSVHVEDRRNSTVFVVGSAAQIKSADPVTRDADGRVIPLSERFNADSNSILFEPAGTYNPGGGEDYSSPHTRLIAELTAKLRDAQARLEEAKRTGAQQERLKISAEMQRLRQRLAVAQQQSKTARADAAAVRKQAKRDVIEAKRETARVEKTMGRQGEAIRELQEDVRRLVEQAGDIRRAQAKIVDFMRERGRLPAAERDRFMRDIVRLGDMKSRAGLVRRFHALVEEIAERAAWHAGGEMRQNVRELLAANAPKLSKRYPTGNRTPETYQTLAKIRDISNFDAARVDLEMQRIADRLEAIANPDPNKPAPAEGREALLERQFLLHTFGNLDEMSEERATAAFETLEDLVKSGALAYQRHQRELKSRFESLRAAAVAVISGGRGQKTPNEERSDELAASKIKAALDAFAIGHESWEWLLDRLAKLDVSSGPLRSELSHFVDLVNRATKAGEDGRLAADQELQTAAQRIFGAKGRALQRKLAANKEVVTQTGVFRDGEEIALSRNQAYKLWQLGQDPTQHKAVGNDPDAPTRWEANGFTDETLDQLEQFMGPDVLAWARWQLDEFFPAYYKGINAVFRELYFVDLPFNNRYSPIVSDYENTREDDLMLGQERRASSVMNGSLYSRIENRRRYRIVDGDTLLMQHIAQMEHFKAWGEPMRELRATMGAQETLKTIRQYHGGAAVKAVNGFLNDFARGGVDEAYALGWLDRLRGNFSRAVIASPVTMLKQITSFPAYAMEIPLADFAAGVAEAVANPLAAKRALHASSMWKSRYEFGWERDVRTAFANAAPGRLSGTKKLSDLAAVMTMLGDMAAVVLGGYSVYRHHLRQNLAAGMGQERAQALALEQFEAATQRTQQSGALKDMGSFQRSPVGKMFTMFATQPISYFRMYVGAIRNLAAGRGSRAENLKRIIFLQFVLPMFFQWVADGFRWTDDDDDDRESIIPGLPKSQLRAMLAGPFNGMFILGNALDGLIRAAQREFTFGGFVGNAVPFLTPVDDFWKAAAAGGRMVEDGEFTIEEAMRMMTEAASGASKVLGLPFDPLMRSASGLVDVVTDNTRAPVRRILGYSPTQAGDQ